MPDFDDLLAANREYAAAFDDAGMAAPARAGVAIVTCMDSRIRPLAMVGLGLNDAKVLRTPGGRVDKTALEGIVLAVNLLGCNRVMVVEHTRCAVASNTAEQLAASVAEACGVDTAGHTFHAIADQTESLADDVQKIRTHALVPDDVEVGGFVYDVDTGLLERIY